MITMKIIHKRNYMTTDDVVVLNDTNEQVACFTTSEGEYLAYTLKDMLKLMGFEVVVETVKTY